MSVATEISKLQTNLMDAYSSIESKGGTLPENQNFDNLSASIESISNTPTWSYDSTTRTLTIS